MEKFTSGIFFDNDKDHIEYVGYCSAIHCVKVGAVEDTGKELLNKFPNYVGFYELLSDEGQDAYDFLADTGLYKQEEYDAVSGIREHHVSECEAWSIRTDEEKKRVALFDFDRTLSLFEGVEPAVLVPGSRVTIEGYANYLFGGTKRVNMLKEMFAMLLDKGVSIKVLTNNGLCSSPGKLIENLAKTLYDGVEMMCSRPPSNAPHEAKIASKLIALVKDKRFHSVCPTPEQLASAGGSRKKKKLTRRRRSRRNQ